MIASLSGEVERLVTGEVVVNVGGVGYLVSVPLSTFATLPEVGKAVKLNIVTVVKEDEISLYGFATMPEERIFKLLQGVNGVGPKLALKILSGLDPARLSDALGKGDVAMLTSISGVGKKLAERLVVELRDKVGAIEGFEGLGPGAGGVLQTTGESEAADALTGLGYPAKVARRAVEAAAKEGMGVEEIVREALKMLAPKR